jgi:acylphosphatase
MARFIAFGPFSHIRGTGPRRTRAGKTLPVFEARFGKIHRSPDGPGKTRLIMNEQRIARTFYVSGSVQGVGYRHYARRAAQQLGVSGYAKNLRDGRVEIYAIGAPDQLDALRGKLEIGPASAVVWEVIEDPSRLLPRYGDDFSIEHESD